MHGGPAFSGHWRDPRRHSICELSVRASGLSGLQAVMSIPGRVGKMPRACRPDAAARWRGPVLPASRPWGHQELDLCPQLKNLRQRRLCVPSGLDVPENIRGIVEQNLNLDFVRQQWDPLVRVVASMSNGTLSADTVTALQRFGSAARGDPLYRAAKHVGRLLRTIYLCDYSPNRSSGARSTASSIAESMCTTCSTPSISARCRMNADGARTSC